jgi:hypothetical protein
MDEFKELTNIIKKLPSVRPPDDFTPKLMAALEKEQSSAFARARNFLFRPHEFSTDVKNIISGTITSYQQYAYLVFFIGIFYLITSLLTLWGLHAALKNANISLWIRLQPCFALFSAILLIFTGILLVIYKQKVILAARNIVILHTAFVITNTLILELMLLLPATIIFTLMLTAPAVLSGIMLINTVQNYINSGLIHNEGYDCA